MCCHRSPVAEHLDEAHICADRIHPLIALQVVDRRVDLVAFPSPEIVQLYSVRKSGNVTIEVAELARDLK